MAHSTTETSTTSMNSTSQLSESAVHDIVKQQIAVAKTVLLQAVDLVNNHLTSDEQLTVNSKHLPGSTIGVKNLLAPVSSFLKTNGKHLRHARDHFVLLIECIHSPSPQVLSYDTRIRNTPMETSLEGAKNALLDAIKQLEDVAPSVNFDAEISLHAITPYMHSFKTTIGRELWFASLHCVHHWSMVRVIAGELGIQLAEDFGFAPSTLVYQDREGPLGKNKL